MNRWGFLLPERVRSKTIHQVGLPKSISELEPQPLPAARVLLIEERPDGYFLIRVSENHDFAGDTWHATLEEAQGQAMFEYGISTAEWAQIPPEEEDAVALLLASG
jgi:hypothetical protein